MYPEVRARRSSPLILNIKTKVRVSFEETRSPPQVMMPAGDVVGFEPPLFEPGENPWQAASHLNFCLDHRSLCGSLFT